LDRIIISISSIFRKSPSLIPMCLLRLFYVVAVLMGCAMPVTVQAQHYVAGDSIGMGVGMASQLPSVAAISIAIRGPKIVEQLKAVPAGSTVFMSLGTNDAVGNLVKGGPDLDRLVAFVKENRLKLYWIGPPCVLKPWDESAKRLDENLRADLSRTGITYVSMRAPSLCDPQVRAKDGVHFTMTGYRMMWQIAAEAANYKVAAAPAAASQPVHHAPVHKKKRKKVHKPVPAPPPVPGAAR
jgi:lysophospholipase L1-like esterase